MARTIHSHICGDKTFEVRKNDRNFKVGDTLILREYYNESREYTGRSVTVKVTHILSGGQFGIDGDRVIMSIAKKGANMLQDRSDEIRMKLLHQRITTFNIYLAKKRFEAEKKIKKSGGNWDAAYAKAFDNIYKRANKIFSGAEDKPVALGD